MTKARLYHGTVVHKRLRPTEHKMNYRVFSLLLDVDHLKQTAGRLRLFGLDRFNLLSLHQKDHGFRDNRSLSEFVWEQIQKCNFEAKVKSIKMLFYPRILGFAFNPLTVYFCLDEEEQPVLMIYEVRNTFGENLTYVLPAGSPQNGAYSHTIEKNFYVSPFNNVEGDYHFHVIAPTEELTVGVALSTEGKPLLRTHFRGQSENISDRILLKTFFAYPAMTLKIVAAIHWEALKLWRKGLKIKDRPAAPKDRIMYGIDHK